MMSFSEIRVGITNDADRQVWRIENQRQHDHLGEYCTLTTSIVFPGGIGAFSQRIHDNESGYAEGQRRVRLIIDSVNQRLSRSEQSTTVKASKEK